MSDHEPPASRPGPDIMWAPWRMAYITSEHDHGFEGERCVFCALPARNDDRAPPRFQGLAVQSLQQRSCGNIALDRDDIAGFHLR